MLVDLQICLPIDCFVNCFSSNEKEEILPGSELLLVLQSLHSHLNFQAQTLIESSTKLLENMSLNNRDLPRTETLPIGIKRHQSTLYCASLLTHGLSIFLLWLTMPSWNFSFLIILILVSIVACWKIRKIYGTYNPGYKCLAGSISGHMS